VAAIRPVVRFVICPGVKFGEKVAVVVIVVFPIVVTPGVPPVVGLLTSPLIPPIRLFSVVWLMFPGGSTTLIGTVTTPVSGGGGGLGGGLGGDGGVGGGLLYTMTVGVVLGGAPPGNVITTLFNAVLRFVEAVKIVAWFSTPCDTE